MFDGLRQSGSFKRTLEAVSGLLGVNVEAALSGKESLDFNRNTVSSLLTAAASALFLEKYLQQHARPDFYAGYSVGQWMAIGAANQFEFAQVAEIIFERAKLMDSCFSDTDGCMISVIGLHQEEVEQACVEARDAGDQVWLSNYNAPGQYSLAMESVSHARVCDRLHQLAPKKLVELPVAGAWHCPLLEPSRTQFESYLAEHTSAPRLVNVANNVSGDLFPDDNQNAHLAAHLTEPVRWEQCIRSLIREGCTEFVEVGYGMQLTKFGFFIDRSKSHKALG
ncbi:ACP S-malonyltransferase [Luminiphilus sp.]|nr:ACP S-malonyltransferase [Luminiphilus sp.]